MIKQQIFLVQLTETITSFKHTFSVVVETNQNSTNTTILDIQLHSTTNTELSNSTKLQYYLQKFNERLRIGELISNNFETFLKGMFVSETCIIKKQQLDEQTNEKIFVTI